MICPIRLLNRLSRVRLSEQTGPVVRWPNWCWNWSVMPFFIVLSLHESTLSKCASKSLISFKLQVKRTHTVYILTQSQSLIGIDIIWSKKVWEWTASPTERDHFYTNFIAISCNFHSFVCRINCSFSKNWLLCNTFLIFLHTFFHIVIITSIAMMA